MKPSEKKTNVLFCNHQSNHDYVGGAEFVLLNIVKNIDKGRYNTFFLSNQDGKVNSYSIEAGAENNIIKHEMFWKFMAPGRKLKESFIKFVKSQDLEIKEIASYIKNNKIGVVISNSIINIIPLLAAKREGIPAIWLIHEILHPQDHMKSKFKKAISAGNLIINPSYKKDALEFLKTKILNLSDRTVFVSRKARGKIFLPGEHREKIITINPPIRKEIFDFAVKTEYAPNNIKTDPLHITFLGILVKHKGVHDFIEIAAQLLRKSYNFYFTITGGTTDVKYLSYLKNKVKKLGIENRLSFTGFLKDPTHIYRKSDIICMTSLYEEPFGMVVTEGMAFGKTVIAYNVGSMEEIIDNNKTGFIIPKSDINRFSDRIISLENNRDLLTKIGKNARQFAIKNFNPAEYTRKIELLLDDLR